jgi:hypothetical protein
VAEAATRAANEQTAFRPKSPYGVAMAAVISLVTHYRESYGLFACSGLLFNHDHRSSIFHSAFGPCLERKLRVLWQLSEVALAAVQKSQNATAPPKRAHVTRAGE